MHRSDQEGKAEERRAASVPEGIRTRVGDEGGWFPSQHFEERRIPRLVVMNTSVDVREEVVADGTMFSMHPLCTGHRGGKPYSLIFMVSEIDNGPTGAQARGGCVQMR